MINQEAIGVLKGQFNLAQGKRSDALGLRADRKIVRAIMFIEEKFQIRTKEMISIFHEMMQFYSVRNKIVSLNIIFSRTVLVVLPLPRAMPWVEID